MLKLDKHNMLEMQVGQTIQYHWRLLGHQGFGLTELRIFNPRPLVAYVDNEDDAVRLCLQTQGRTSGIYIGTQPRPVYLFDRAPNCWRPAHSGPNGNCACDRDIEYITIVFFDIDVISAERTEGYPASDQELLQSLRAAQLLAQEDGFALSSTICCSGNGHYVLAAILPIPVYSDEEAAKFKQFCTLMAARVAGQVTGVKFDPVYNLSRVHRVAGSINRKGKAAAERPHRRAYFVTEPIMERSITVHHMILNTEVELRQHAAIELPQSIHCNLEKLKECEFIKWCKEFPQQVSEPLWWGLITNLARLEGGIALIHEISRLDPVRYDYANTQYKIQKTIDAGYRPVACSTLISDAMTCPGRGKFECSRVGKCRARSPMYLATLRTIYQR